MGAPFLSSKVAAIFGPIANALVLQSPDNSWEWGFFCNKTPAEA
jgi:hypothetical protein